MRENLRMLCSILETRVILLHLELLFVEIATCVRAGGGSRLCPNPTPAAESGLTWKCSQYFVSPLFCACFFLIVFVRPPGNPEQNRLQLDKTMYAREKLKRVSGQRTGLLSINVEIYFALSLSSDCFWRFESQLSLFKTIWKVLQSGIPDATADADPVTRAPVLRFDRSGWIDGKMDAEKRTDRPPAGHLHIQGA
jgi:hypothetical protein